MKNKLRKTVRKPTLKEYALVPITDPAEQAAIDRLFDRAENSTASRNPRKPKSGKRK